MPFIGLNEAASNTVLEQGYTVIGFLLASNSINALFLFNVIAFFSLDQRQTPASASRSAYYDAL